MRYAALALAVLFSLPLSGFAAPAPDRFTAMDSDKDGALSWEEFSAASGMKRAAFDAIDANKDGRISRDEWDGFIKNHGSRMGSGSSTAPSPSMPPSGGRGDSGDLPLLSAPAAAPAVQPKSSQPQNANDLPLLSPPVTTTPQRQAPAASAPDLPLLEPPKP